ncbi:MAG: hypothetical protein Q9170_007252 [Blastenia crenularia]
MPHTTTSRILLLDAYDSFSNNVISLLESELPEVQVTSVKIDATISNLPAYLRGFDAVVAGPGPGHPGNPKDVGIIAKLWQLHDDDIIPVLGICLGFQSLVAAFGGTVTRLPAPRHGIVRKVTHDDTSIMNGIGIVSPVQYHSLHAQLASDTSTFGADGDLEPLAWDLEANNSDSAKIGEHAANPHRILMAVKHRKKPFYGVQFHPESICSDQACQRVVENWWLQAQQWNKLRGPRNRGDALEETPSRFAKPKDSLLDIDALQDLCLQASIGPTSTAGALDSFSAIYPRAMPLEPRQVISRTLPLNELLVPQIHELIKARDGDAVLLDSEPYQSADIGTHSIIGVIGADTIKLDYSIGATAINVRQGEQKDVLNFACFGTSVFDYLKSFMATCKAMGGDPNIPFWGGLIGYISYEACLETIGVRTSSPDGKPDICFAFVEQSVVVDHQRQQIHIQSIKEDDDRWVQTVAATLGTLHPEPLEVPIVKLGSFVTYPDPSSYKAKIQKCQDYIQSGDSYELCLTNQATVNARHLANPWPLYLRLRSLNSAPFSAYLRLGGATLISSSPERFMRWSRPSVSYDNFAVETSSIVQFRPIKGTVKRHPNGFDKPAITLEQATAMLSTPKERAENLMIADLIRHDLHGVAGSGNVCVPKLMVVEEYATLFQLVTVVEGTLINRNLHLLDPPSLAPSSPRSPNNSPPTTPSSSPSSSSSAYESMNTSTSQMLSGRPPADRSGINVLAASLPPGSMTGAPKRRSCTLLREIEEEQPRGIYSGVVGYMDVGGGGDFSVVIRSAFRYDSHTTSAKQDEQGERDTWHVGAGGAITSLSTEEGEWEEMMAKLGSTLQMFE